MLLKIIRVLLYACVCVCVSTRALVCASVTLHSSEEFLIHLRYVNQVLLNFPSLLGLDCEYSYIMQTLCISYQAIPAPKEQKAGLLRCLSGR